MTRDRHAHRFLSATEWAESKARRQVEAAADRAVIASAAREAREWTPKVYADGLPILTPSTWRAMGRLSSDDAGMARHCYCTCGRCSACEFFADIDRLPSDRHDRVHVVDVEAPLFWSVEAALDRYVTIKQHGYGAKSVAGTVVQVGEMGAIVTGGVSEGTREQLEAERVAAVEQALRVAFDAGNDRGLGAAACVAILLARVVGDEVVRKGRDGKPYRRRVPVDAAELGGKYGVTSEAVGALVKSGMRRLRVEMAARGLIPEPVAKRGLGDEIARRRRALAGRRCA